jgi:hypothetical protein
MPGPARAGRLALLWALPGAAWGAWVGVRGISRILPHLNADTMAPLFVWGFYLLLGLMGLGAGAVLSGALGFGIGRLLRRMQLKTAAIVVVTAVVNAAVLWVAAQGITTAFPVLRAAEAPPVVTAPAGRGQAAQKTCGDAPPGDARERALWEQECR